ncbi:MAG: DNA-3-methyladenine glycosylase I [bacterium]
MDKKPVSYCEVVENLPPDNLHKIYHDTLYGFAVTTDTGLFERLILEINQAGLSWNTILHKKSNFYQAYDDYDIQKIAAYGDSDRQRLLNDAGIIRNRLKIEAAIYNAQVILGLQLEFGSFKIWLDQHRGLTRPEWTMLFKKTFKFTGGEIVNEFLVSTGYLPGAHVESCSIRKIIENQKRLDVVV